MELKQGKYYRTRDGRKAKVIATDLPENCNGCTCVCIVFTKYGVWNEWAFYKNGQAYDNCAIGLNLIEPWQEKLEVGKWYVDDDGDYIEIIAIRSSRYIYTRYKADGVYSYATSLFVNRIYSGDYKLIDPPSWAQEAKNERI